MEKYDLTFYQAVEQLFEHDQWVEADKMPKNCFLKVNNGGHTILVNSDRSGHPESLYFETAQPLYADMINWKFRVVKRSVVIGATKRLEGE